MRLGSTNRQADAELVAELQRGVAGVSFDALPMPELSKDALVHADYSRRGSPTWIAFFDDRIEVESPGLLLPGLTIDDIKRGVSQLRNPVFARVFRELNLTEQWGSGIPGIFRQAAAENLPEPVIEELAGRLRFTIPLKQIVPLSREQSRATHAPDQSEKGSRVESGSQSGAQSILVLQALSLQSLCAAD